MFILVCSSRVKMKAAVNIKRKRKKKLKEIRRTGERHKLKKYFTICFVEIPYKGFFVLNNLNIFPG